MMAKRNITTNELARMVKDGFDELRETMARKDALSGLRGDVAAFQKWVMRRFDSVDYDLKAIKKQLDRVVFRHEFEKLEGRVKEIEDLLAVVAKRH